MHVGSIEGDISLRDAPAIAALKNVTREAQSFKQTMGSTLGEAGTVGAKGFIQGINSELGKKSLMGQSLKMAMGGGAVMGLSMAGNELSSLTKNMVEMKDAFKEGKISGGEFAEKIASSIPVLGKFWEAGRNIREILTGEEAAMRKLNAAFDAQIAANEKSLAVAQKYRQELKAGMALKNEMADALALKNNPNLAPDMTLKHNMDRINEAFPSFSKLVQQKGGMNQAALDLDNQIRAKQEAADKAQAAQKAADAALANSKDNPLSLAPFGKDLYDSAHGKLADTYQEAADKAKILSTTLQGQLLDLKALRKEADGYKDTVAEALKTRDSDLGDIVTKNAEADAKAWKDTWTKAADWVGNVLKDAFKPAKEESAQAVTTQYKQLPRTGQDVSEWNLSSHAAYRGHTVTTDDLTPGYAAVVQEAAKTTADNTSEAKGLLKAILDALTIKQPPKNIFDMVASGSW